LVEFQPDGVQPLTSFSDTRQSLIFCRLIDDWSKDLVVDLVDLKLNRSFFLLQSLNLRPKPLELVIPFFRWIDSRRLRLCGFFRFFRRRGLVRRFLCCRRLAFRRSAFRGFGGVRSCFRLFCLFSFGACSGGSTCSSRRGRAGITLCLYYFSRLEVRPSLPFLSDFGRGRILPLRG